MWSSTARSVLVIQILLVLICSYSANAFPAGAGACPGGEAAVGSPHKEGREVTTGSLSDGGFGVAINDIFLLVDDEPVSITVAELNNITLQATDENLFKGFLIRIGPPPGTANSKDLRNSIYPYGDDTMAQIATTPCVETEFVGGLTQTNSDFKSQVTGSLLLEEVMDEVSVDVTVVVENVGSSSIYYYSNFRLTAVEAVPVDSPIADPPTEDIPSEETEESAITPSNETMTGANGTESTGGIGLEEEGPSAEGQSEEGDTPSTGTSAAFRPSTFSFTAGAILAGVAGVMGLIL